MSTEPFAIKDEGVAHPIAGSWRSIFQEVVKAFAKGDFELSRGVPGVEPVDTDIASQNREYVREYGEVLVELPETTWGTSCAHWMGSYWEVLIDLYTENEGYSDLVLTGRMSEQNGKPQLTVGLIYVP
ncbi:hypothetical protein KDW99_13610 [Marinomonas rhizomae]|uniref:DUF7668 domain-containing protein n=1 Tax=Marinomonas rhizomae TaxID=491948 RepID=UPI0021032642|nr:hypothetical protein [Marinomonas rhizomae]UTV98297.1 hypothetical protein KDW99_13610 [Marinomonas rhizomae]